MVSVALGRRSEESTAPAPRVNVVGIAILVVAVVVGLAGCSLAEKGSHLAQDELDVAVDEIN